jgi:glutamate-1-semialdehyde 2,1-aminomutase
LAQVTKRFSASGIELVRFTNSGTEANTMALAAAVAYTGRKKIVVFRNGYHGGTLHFPSTLSKPNVNLPHDFVVAPYNDIPGVRSIIEGLSSNSLAAILVEPIQGSGGCIVGARDFLQYLNAAAHKLGALFIVDEVMTSRLFYNGLSAFLDLKPDLITLGKWVGGGMTFGAFGGRRDGGVMSMFDPRNGMLGHSGTFNNNIVTMAAGCAGLDIYNEDAVIRLNTLGESLKSGVEKVLRNHGVSKLSESSRCPQKNEDESPFTGINSEHPSNGISVESLLLSEERGERSTMWISGQGSMLHIHFAGGGEASLKPLFWHHMLDHGIYLAQRGFIVLNLELNEGHVDQFVRAVDAFVRKYRVSLTA